MKESLIKNVVKRRANDLAIKIKERNSDAGRKPIDRTVNVTNRREVLAQEIASTFHEETRLKLYRTYCQKYPLRLILRAYAEAKSIPDEEVKRSRAAIFFYLIKRYSHEKQPINNHSRN